MRSVGREGEIVEAGLQADVVDDQLALVRRNDVADLVLDGFEDLLGLLDAGAGRGLAQRCRDLSRIAARLEVREQLREWVDDLEAEAQAGEGLHPLVGL